MAVGTSVFEVLDLDPRLRECQSKVESVTPGQATNQESIEKPRAKYRPVETFQQIWPRSGHRNERDPQIALFCD